MRKTEVAVLLAVCSAFDHRTVGETDVEVWYEVIGHLDFIPCRKAIFMHYGRTTDWIGPSHILDEVKGRKLTPTPTNAGLPDADPEDPVAYIAALREGRVLELPPGDGLDWKRLKEIAEAKAIDPPEQETA